MGQLYHFYTMSFDVPVVPSDPYLGVNFTVAVTLPTGEVIDGVEGFYSGVGRATGRPTYSARVYCGWVGDYSAVTNSSLGSLHGLRARFGVAPDSAYPGAKGKLRLHSDDWYQFQYDDGDWFLHIGDTGYRYLADGEPLWQQYIDQSVQDLGATKIVVWSAGTRATHSLAQLYTPSLVAMNLTYWALMEDRLVYALTTYPRIQLQLIVYAQDTDRANQAGSPYGGNTPAGRMAGYTAAYMQARWSSFANVQWCIVNDADGLVSTSFVDKIGTGMRAREKWGTLITSHRTRSGRYPFSRSPWSSVSTLLTLDALQGMEVVAQRSAQRMPVVIAQDRFEFYHPVTAPKPANWSAPNFFRGLMWASLVSGGHATYGGIATWDTWISGCSATKCPGVRGYADMVNRGVLQDGGRDFQHIHTFFNASLTRNGTVLGLPSLVGLAPNNTLCGSDPNVNICAASATVLLMYSRAASGKTLTVAWPPSINPQAPAFQVDATCFDPVSGQFDSPVVTVNPGAGIIAITCPGVASAGRAERVVRVLRR